MMARIMTFRDRRLYAALAVIFVAAAILLGLFLLRWHAKQTSVLSIGTGHYSVRVVSDEPGRIKGLSGTQSLPNNQGMLFKFNEDDRWGIWMKDMHYSIDIVWLDKSKAVVDMIPNVSPTSYPSTVFKPKVPARYVLELNAGSIKDASITLGSRASFGDTREGKA